MYSELQAALARRNSTLSEIHPDNASPIFHSPKHDRQQQAVSSPATESEE